MINIQCQCFLSLSLYGTCSIAMNRQEYCVFADCRHCRDEQWHRMGMAEHNTETCGIFLLVWINGVGMKNKSIRFHGWPTMVLCLSTDWWIFGFSPVRKASRIILFYVISIEWTIFYRKIKRHTYKMCMNIYFYVHLVMERKDSGKCYHCSLGC